MDGSLLLAVSGRRWKGRSRPYAEIATARKQSLAVLEADALRLSECGPLKGKRVGHIAVIDPSPE
jgi:hypothetical protein